MSHPDRGAGRPAPAPEKPTTGESTFGAAAMEFFQAIEAYKLSSRRRFPTWSEVLGVAQSLGYSKPAG